MLQVPIAVPLKSWLLWPPPFGYYPAALGPLGLFPVFFKFVSVYMYTTYKYIYIKCIYCVYACIMCILCNHVRAVITVMCYIAYTSKVISYAHLIYTVLYMHVSTTL